jgi:hypothetical protein
MEKFLHQVAKEIINSGDYYQKTVVLPNKRSGVFLKKAIMDIEQKPVLAPQILSIQDFIDSLSIYQQADQLYLLFEFFQAYKQIYKEKAQNFDEFINWAHPVLADFNLLDAFDIDAKEVFTYINEVKKIEDWQLKPSQPKLINDYLKFYESLYDLYKSFKERLQEKKIGYTGMISRYVAQHIEEITSRFQKNQIVFAGFNALTATQEKIIKFLVDNQKAVIYWDADEYYMKPGFEAGKFLLKHRKNFKDFKWTGNYIDKAKHIELIAVQGKASQVQAVAKILKEKDNNSTEQLETAIVLNEDDLLLPLINSLPDNISSVNITLGLPLGQIPVVSVFALLLKLYYEKEKYGRFNIETLINLINLPYFDNLLSVKEKQDNELLYNELSKFKTNLISEKLMFDILSQSNSFIKKWIFKNTDVKALLNVFLEILLFLSKKDLPDIDKPAVAKLEKTFTYLKEFIEKTGEINNIKTFRVLFYRLLNQERLNFEGEPLQGLQIMGLLETRLLDFEHLIITSMNEGILPKGKSEHSIIPFELKKHFGLPMHDDQNSIAAYHFYRLLQRAKKISLIYNDDLNNFGSGEQSRFLLQIKNEWHNNTHIIEEKSLRFSTELLSQNYLSISKNDWILQRIRQIAKSGFSSSSLNTYIRNPLIFYKEKILQLSEPEPRNESIPSYVMGNIIHQVLEQLYRTVTGKLLTISDLDRMLQLYEDMSLKTFIFHSFGEDIPARMDLINGKNLIIFEIIKKNIKDIILQDKKLVLNGNILQIIDVEKYYIHKLPVKGQEIYIKGIIDRIDRLNGTLRIIDYKTGKVNSNNLAFNDTDKSLLNLLETADYDKLFQLLTYAWLYYHSGQVLTVDLPFTAGIISTRYHKSGVFNAKINGNQDIDVEIIKEFEKVLIRLTTEILNPDIPFIETDATY